MVKQGFEESPVLRKLKSVVQVAKAGDRSKAIHLFSSVSIYEKKFAVCRQSQSGKPL